MKQIDLETQQQIIDEKEQSGTISAEEMAYR